MRDCLHPIATPTPGETQNIKRPTNVFLAGCGCYLPKKRLTNQALAQMIDTSDRWIVERTGIHERRIAAKEENTSDLAVKSALPAIEMAKLRKEDIDLLIIATTTPDLTFPATATIVQQKLQIPPCIAFDVQAVCSGFIYALSIAEKFLRVGEAENALVIGAETFSRLLDWQDRSTCVLFGDGAGCVIMSKNKSAPESTSESVKESAPESVKESTPESVKKSTQESFSHQQIQSCFYGAHLYADGNLQNLLYVDGGPSSTQTTGHVRMIGPELFKHAVGKLSHSTARILSTHGFDIHDLDWMIPHQANIRIIKSVAQKTGMALDKIITTIGQHGNTSAASIPIALATALQEGKIKKGELILMEAVGAGLTWGTALLRW